MGMDHESLDLCVTARGGASPFPVLSRDDARNSELDGLGGLNAAYNVEALVRKAVADDIINRRLITRR